MPAILLYDFSFHLCTELICRHTSWLSNHSPCCLRLYYKSRWNLWIMLQKPCVLRGFIHSPFVLSSIYNKVQLCTLRLHWVFIEVTQQRRAEGLLRISRVFIQESILLQVCWQQICSALSSNFVCLLDWNLHCGHAVGLFLEISYGKYRYF